MAALGAVVRSEVHRRWRSLLLLVVLVAMVGGVVSTAAAGARRTSTAFDRFATETLARDVRVQVDDPELTEQVLGAVEALTHVSATGRVEMFPVFPDPEHLDASDYDLVVMASPDGGLFRDVERPAVLEGRLPDPAEPHEVSINEFARDQLGLGVGDRLPVLSFEPGALAILWEGGAFPGFEGPPVTFVITGVARTADEISQNPEAVNPLVRATPAFHARYGEEMDGLGVMLGARLENGSADVPAVRDAVRAAAGPTGEVFVDAASQEYANELRGATDVLANALWVFAVVAAAAGALVVGGAVSREISNLATNDPVLRSLGLDRRWRTLCVALPVIGAAVVGAVAAMVAMVAASSMMPIGLARRAEPDLGFDIDFLVLMAGFVTIVVTCVAWGIMGARRRLRVEQRSEAGTPSAVATTAVSAGLGPVGVQVLRHALERGPGQRVIPVRSALVAAVVGFAGLVGAIVVTTSLGELVADPARYGWGWSAEPDVESFEETARALAADERIEAVGLARYRAVEIEGLSLNAMAITEIGGDLTAVLRSGRHPVQPSEVALGARTADRLGVSVGDRVEATSSEGTATVELDVVGIAVLRPVENPEPGSGALFTPEGLDRVARSEGFRSVLIRYPDGMDQQALEQALLDDHQLEFSVYSRPRLPTGIANLEQTTGVVRALGLFFALLGVAGVGHALTVATRRRRHDLAVLRSLGLRRSQARAIVTGHATVLAIAGVLGGATLGIAAGRLVWRLMIEGQGVLDASTTPVVVVTLAAFAALIGAALAAQWPARLASQRPLASLLREE